MQVSEQISEMLREADITEYLQMQTGQADQQDSRLTHTEQVDKTQKEGIKAIKNQCLAYLARREHSRVELYQKLIAKSFHTADIYSVLDELQENAYQSDERFADMYIRSRIQSGDGPFKIKIALRAKGICDSLVLAVFDKLNVDWVERAKSIKEKRFGSLLNMDAIDATGSIDSINGVMDQEEALALKAKQVRYLKNKGYYQDHINAVVESRA